MELPCPTNSFNVNIGVLGHIDSGKTSLCKVLSTVASTASFDKNPQSQERGITLDLGFSSFSVPLPEHLSKELRAKNVLHIQYTLVDCPGHASLIRTIISGAQIMDLMLLVIDVTKGIQTQTAECLIIGQITCTKMIVVLNKIDLLPEETRLQVIEKMKIRLQKTLQTTKFTGCPIVPVATRNGQSECIDRGNMLGINELIQTLKEMTYIPERNPIGPPLFSVDHCFTIKGQGTILTGTMLSGIFKVNDPIEIASVRETRKIKSMQMFRLPVQQAIKGDRVGICVANFDSKLLERGFAATPGALHFVHAAVISLHKIAFYKHPVKSRAKFHITLGHDTVMGKIQLFREESTSFSSTDEFNISKEYAYLDELPEKISVTGATDSGASSDFPVYALIELETAVVAQKGQLLIASKLDTDIHQNACRLAFFGNLLTIFSDKDYQASQLPQLRIFKVKEKTGIVERIQDDYSVIVRNMVKKETDTTKFERMKVRLSTGEVGFIESTFGKSGKLKITIPEGLRESTITLLTKTSKTKVAKDELSDIAAVSSDPGITASVTVQLEFKRYIYDTRNQMIQT